MERWNESHFEASKIIDICFSTILLKNIHLIIRNLNKRKIQIIRITLNEIKKFHKVKSLLLYSSKENLRNGLRTSSNQTARTIYIEKIIK